MTMYYSIDAWVQLPDGQGPRMIPLIGSESRFENDVLREIAAEVDDAATAFDLAGQDNRGLGYPFRAEALTAVDLVELRHLQGAHRLADEIEAALALLEDRRSYVASYPYIALLRPEGADHGPCQARAHFHRGKSRPCQGRTLYLRITPTGEHLKLCAHHAPATFDGKEIDVEDAVLDERGRNSAWRLGFDYADEPHEKD